MRPIPSFAHESRAASEGGRVYGTVLSLQVTVTSPGLTRGAPSALVRASPGPSTHSSRRMCSVTIVDVDFTEGQCLPFAVMNNNSNNNELDECPLPPVLSICLPSLSQMSHEH